MSDDDKVGFLITVTRQGHSPFTSFHFVRAKSISDAYIQVCQDRNEICQHPDIRLQGHVISLSEVAPALRLKELAEFYWNAGRQAEANPNHDSTFEEFWEEHGVDFDDS